MMTPYIPKGNMGLGMMYPVGVGNGDAVLLSGNAGCVNPLSKVSENIHLQREVPSCTKGSISDSSQAAHIFTWMNVMLWRLQSTNQAWINIASTKS